MAACLRAGARSAHAHRCVRAESGGKLREKGQVCSEHHLVLGLSCLLQDSSLGSKPEVMKAVAPLQESTVSLDLCNVSRREVRISGRAVSGSTANSIPNLEYWDKDLSVGSAISSTASR